MIVPTEFDDIRPYTSEEMPHILRELSSDPEFRAVVERVFPNVPFEGIMAKVLACKTILEFQTSVPYYFLNDLIARQTNGCDFDSAGLDKTGTYTFVSNHRDIVLDSAFLSKFLVDSGFPDTAEIAIGDNLLSHGWIRKLVRLNKAFIVRRGLSGRELLEASMQLGRYIRFAISEKGESIWIAQRQGRAKDSNDRTQDAMLKMLAFGGTERTVQERLCALHIVPLSISYEYDPCDFLKAREFWLRSLNPQYRKSREEDVVSMQTGITGYKGRVHYQVTRPLDEFLRSLPEGVVRNDLFRMIADQIDRQIHSAYKMYPNNYVAYDMLSSAERFTKYYTAADRKHFEEYLAAQLKKVDLPDADPAFLRNAILSMYANPLINYNAARATEDGLWND